jgi:hypothetical protein
MPGGRWINELPIAFFPVRAHRGRRDRRDGRRDERPVTGLDRVERDAVVVTCAISAGIHAALTPDHLSEGARAGLGFLGAAVLLATLAVVLTGRPKSTAALATAGVVLTGLIASHALAVTTGLPVLHPEPEPLDGLALVTKSVEAVGLLAAAHLVRRPRPGLAPSPRPRGLLT